MRVTSSAFQKEYGRYASLAKREPVTITNHGRDELVILPAHEYERLQQLGGQASRSIEEREQERSTADLPRLHMKTTRGGKSAKYRRPSIRERR